MPYKLLEFLGCEEQRITQKYITTFRYFLTYKSNFAEITQIKLKWNILSNSNLIDMVR